MSNIIIETQINKLIEDYNSKIADCDNMIEDAKVKERSARKCGKVNDDARDQSIKWSVRRTAYQKAQSDIESILDFA